MLSIKSVRQKHQASNDLLKLLDEFRRMVNVCVAIGIEENISSRMTLSFATYPRLSRDILGSNRLGAIGIATGILRNYRKAVRKNPWTRVPFARKLILTTCYGFKIRNGLLRLPVKPREYVYLKLNDHTLQAISALNVRSVTLTPGWVSISYSKEMVEIEPEEYLGVDCNLDNVTTASVNGTARFDLSKATRINAN